MHPNVWKILAVRSEIYDEAICFLSMAGGYKILSV